MTFLPDAGQSLALDHAAGPLLVLGAPGTGKTAVLRERFVRLIEGGADPERVALVVRTREARARARRFLLERLRSSMGAVRVLTVHGLANLVMAQRFRDLGYDRPPRVLSAPDHFSRVSELLVGEDRADWPSCGAMLGMRGFADQVRQFLLRAQEGLAAPEDVVERAEAAGTSGWGEVGRFYRRYLQIMDQQGEVDFAGLVNQAAAAAGQGQPLFEHVMVDDYQEATLATERMVLELRPASLVVAGDAGSHVFSFQGTTDRPLRRFPEAFPGASMLTLEVPHRGAEVDREAWSMPHTSEEHAAVARELRRLRVQSGIPWNEMAVVVRRQGANLGGLLRALDDAGIPRAAPEGGLSLLSEPAVFPFVLALRWLARRAERDGLVESLLTSELAQLSPAVARSLVRSARAAGRPPSGALDHRGGLAPEEAEAVRSLGRVLDHAARAADRSVLDAFATLWRELPYSRRLVEAAEASALARRDVEAVLALGDAVSRAGERTDASVQAFLALLESGEDGPGPAGEAIDRTPPAVRVLTAHASAGLEFDAVVVVGAVEGNYPSLSRPEPMFDLALLEGEVRQSDRNRLRLEDERRLFGVVSTRARRRLLFTASESSGEEGAQTTRSRFVSELGLRWQPVGAPRSADPLTVAEAAAAWRRELADSSAPPGRRVAALDGLLALEVDPSRWWFQRDWTGTGRPLHETIRVSYSKVDRLENCGLQFVLSEELGLEGEAGYHAWVGHLVHRIIEDCERGSIARDEDALVAEAERRWQPQRFPSHAVSEAFRRTVTRRMLPAWLAAYGRTPALAGEIRFSFQFEGATVTGVIDRVGAVSSGGSQITDYKTGRSRSAARPEENLQLGIYYLALNRADELKGYRPAKAVELAFLKELRDGSVVRSQLAMNSSAQHEFAEAMAGRLAGLIHRLEELYRTEVYRPDPQANCRFCDFHSLCPLFPEGKELFPARARPVRADAAAGGPGGVEVRT